VDVYVKEPDTWHPEVTYAPALIYLGRLAEARTLVDKWLKENRRDAATVVAVDALLLVQEGKPGQAAEAIARAIPLCEGFGDVHHPQHVIALAHARLGHEREAVEWLEKAADNGLPIYPAFEKDPYLAGLRGDARFEAFMRKLKALWGITRPRSDRTSAC
jgi:tetratricopeptide (TPR) repeat protein